jgi:hypothetical protein
MTTKGSCLCGEVRYEIEGDFENFYLCHCARCRKGTGSAHASNLISDTGSLNWVSGQHLVKVYRLPSTRHTRSFCLSCGSALPSYDEGLLVVPAGGVDSDISSTPDAHIFVASRACWDDDLEKLPQLRELPD